MTNENKDFSEAYIKFKKEFLDLLKNSELNEANRAIRSILYYPGSFESESMWVDALGLYLKLVREFKDVTLEDLIESVIDTPTNADALYDLAYVLYEKGAYAIAATMLKKADEILPNDKNIMNELVSNLEALMMNREACNLLLNAKDLLEKSELSRYLNGFNHMMIGNLDVPAKVIPTLQDSNDDNILFMAKSLQAMLDRANILKQTRSLNDRDLRGWHMVLNGVILLHYSPFALDDGMHGRYAYISDSPSLCMDGIKRLEKLIKICNLNIPQIISLPDRSSKILALATSKMLKKPLINYDVAKKQKGLLVAYDLETSCTPDIVTEIADHVPGQVLWAHASSWTYPYPFAPDITTYLFEQNASFWGGERMTFDQKTKNVTHAAPNESPIDEIALEIINAKLDDEYVQDEDDLITLTKNLDQLDGYSKAGIHKKEGRRIRQRLGSPVHSNRFIM